MAASAVWLSMNSKGCMLAARFDLPDRRNNVWIRSAAADVSAQAFADFIVAKRIRSRFFEHRYRRKNLSRRAVAALKCIAFDEGGLHGVQLACLRQTFDRGDGAILHRGCQRE